MPQPSTVLYEVAPDANAEVVRRHLVRLRRESGIGGRIALALPASWDEFDNMARMRLLQRQAQLLQIDIALITQHEATRKAAKQVGIPIFARSDQAVKRQWRMRPLLPLVNPKQPNAGLPEAPHWQQEQVVTRASRQHVRRARQHRIESEERYRRPMPVWLRWFGYLFMGGLIGLFLLGFTFYVLPAATVTLIPGQELLVVSVRITADPGLDVADFVENRLPARLVEANIEERGTISTSGSRQKATVKAEGRVTFSNLGGTPLRIPDGTIVSTTTGTPVSFRTRGEVDLPGGFGSRVEAFIEALEPGAQGNVLPNTINTVSGALRFRTRVSNSSTTSGGGAQLVSVVTQADKDRLLAETSARAEAQAYETLSELLEPGEWLPVESVQTFVIAQAFSGFNDEEAQQLELGMNVLARGASIEDQLSTEAALRELQNRVPPRGQLVADTIAFRREPGVVAVGNAVQFTMTASAEYVIPIDPADVRTAIVGLTPAAALDVLQSRWSLAGPPEIYRDPELLPTLPTIPSRIQVRIEYQDDEMIER
ncbi:baseplate J/gp47 family protein [Chloroflexi bacterium TSY]|nr:baseplate J/gp47 family protein [Chloroflexi bacterium TSY]